MAVDRVNWQESFPSDEIPRLPCPKCVRGHLHLLEGSLRIVEPGFSNEARTEDAWEPHWISERFSLTLVCDMPKCGEVVNVVGETTHIEVATEDYGWSYVSHLVPRAMFPAPPIIVLPSELSIDIRRLVDSSFSLFWMDQSACANRLRASLEVLLTEFKIPKEVKTKKGEMRLLRLNERIDQFKAVDPTHAPTLDALRVFGNSGSHPGEVSREWLLDAYEIYEDALAELIGKRSATIDAIRKKLAAGKVTP